MILKSTPLSRDIRNTFAEVHLAVKAKTRKKFAVKVLKPSIIRKFDRVINDFQGGIYREAVREWKSVLEKDPSNKIVKNLILTAEKNIK